MTGEERIKIAIQKRGHLTDVSKNFLESLGLSFPANGKKLIHRCNKHPIDVIFVRDDDIPKYVSYSLVDFGIVGSDVLKEQKAEIKILRKLGSLRWKIVLAAPAQLGIKLVKELNGKVIATKYTNTLRHFLKKNKVSAKIFTICGSVEITPYLKAADAVCDVVETGKTLKNFDLVPLETVLNCHIVLIESSSKNKLKRKYSKIFTNQNFTNIKKRL